MPISIRALSGSGITLEALRQEVFTATPESRLVFVKGSAAAVQFPQICPNCGRPATVSLAIERDFSLIAHNSDDSPNESIHAVERFDVPFCLDCDQARDLQLTRPGAWIHLKRIFSSGEGMGGAVVVGIGFAFLVSAVTEWNWFPLALSLWPFAVGGWLMRSTWRKTRHMAVPHPTPVDLTVDFTPSLALDFEPEWRAFLFQSHPYAEAFAHANSAAIWHPASPEAARATARRSRKSRATAFAVGAFVAAALLWSLWDEYLSGYFTP